MNGRAAPAGAAVATGLAPPMEALRCGALHEWLCPEDEANESDQDHHVRGQDVRRQGFRGWTAPVLVFVHLAHRALLTKQESGGLVVWIGRRIWPGGHALARVALAAEVGDAPGRVAEPGGVFIA